MKWWEWLLLGIGALTALYLIGSALLALYALNKVNKSIKDMGDSWDDNWPNL
jgi:hypothetical protein